MKASYNEPPRYSKNIPILGAAREYSANTPRFLQRLRRQLGDVFSFKLLNKWVTIGFSESYVRQFYRANDEVLSFIEPLNRMRFPQIVGAVASKDKWDALMYIVHRQLMPHYNRMITRIDQSVVANLNRLLPGSSGVAQLTDIIDHLVISMSCRVLCTPMADNDVFIHLVNKIAEHGTLQLRRPGFLGHAVMRRCAQVRAKMAALLQREINRRRQMHVKYEDLLQFVMDADLGEVRAATGPVYQGRDCLPDEFIIDSVIGLFLGSVANTNSIIINAVNHIVSDKNLYQRLMQEIQRNDELLKQDISKEALRHFSFVADIVSETNRYYATVLSVRQTESVYPIAGTDYDVPKGRLLTVSPQVLMRNDQRYANPEGYQPGKQFDEKVQHNKIGYRDNLGFGDGLHYCKGARLADIECRIALIRLFQRYELQPLSAPDLEQVNWTTLGAGVIERPLHFAYVARVCDAQKLVVPLNEVVAKFS